MRTWFCGVRGGQALRIRHWQILRANRKSGNLPELVEADTLRARECGATPRSMREAFLLGVGNILAAGLARQQFFALALTLACAVFACSAPDASAIGIAPQQNATRPADPAAQTAANKRAVKLVTDETGRRMAIPLHVQRVVSLAPNLTETIYALGLDNKLAGDTTYCDIPPAAKDKPHVGSPQDPSLEAIVALHPDLVLATTSINRAQTADALLKIGVPVYTSDPHTIAGMLRATAALADLLGASEQGAKLVAELQRRLDTLHAALQDWPMAHVLFVVWADPLISIGQNTFVADALRWAGAESIIVATQNWPQVSMEEVVRLQPEYILLTSDHLAAETHEHVNNLRDRPAWSDLHAVKDGHVVMASDEFTRPSPGLVDAIESLAHELHPEAFAPKTENNKMKMENGARYYAAMAAAASWRGCGTCAR
jgi:iron complex transport system substrate-binding protein